LLRSWENFRTIQPDRLIGEEASLSAGDKL
jgi:hypothetical protein